MLTFTEAQVLAWITPLLWPFLRALALFTTLPVLGTRAVPARVRVALAAFIAFVAQPLIPVAPEVPLDSPVAFLMAAQQVFIGLTLGFCVRLVFAAVEFAGELVGLQMGLNFAAFFDPITASTATTTSRFFGTIIALLFVVGNGHLVVIGALVQSFNVFPVTPEPLAFLERIQPHRLGADIFAIGLWIALPLITMLLLVNLVLGVISRVAPQINIFAIGFPVTLSVGLLGLLLTLPWLQAPFEMALTRVLAQFQ
jgi:flagellar biosynthetic protein FliR